MKKLLFALVFGAIAVPASAQFEQGRMLIGGAFGLDFKKRSDKDDGRTTELYRGRTVTFDPDFGYFVANRFAIGAGLSITNTREEYNSNDVIYNRESFTFSPLFRYYLPNKIFFQLRVPLGSATTTINDDSDISTRKYGVAGVSPAVGYAIMLNSNVALEPMLQFSSIAYRNKDNADREVENTLALRMGIQVYLGR